MSPVRSPARRSPRTPQAGQGGFTLSVAQLRINQRISSAAVRRSNESLQLLDPIRPIENQPNRPIGWRTEDLRADAVTPSKLAPQLREGQPRWAVVNGETGERVRQKGAPASAKLAAGEYSVTWDRDITGCAVNGTVASPGTEAPPAGRSVTTWVQAGSPTVLRVRTVAPSAVPAVGEDLGFSATDTPFHVTVLC